MTIVSANRTGTKAIDFAGNNETWTVQPGVFVWGSSIGANSGYNNNTLINNGNILGTDQGVWFNGDSLVKNTQSGSIYGYTYGIHLDLSASRSAVVNLGKIIGLYDGVRFDALAAGVSLNNSGEILGEEAGVRLLSQLSGGNIINSGRIEARQAGFGEGIVVGVANSLTCSITNTATGLIKGPDNAIYIAAGKLSFTNHGKVIGDILDVQGIDDVVVNSGTIHGLVELGDGNDVFDGNGGTSGLVFGGAGNDRLAGGPKGDNLDGFSGNDILTGRLGADHFIFDAAPNAPTNVDRISDFTPAQGDKIVLSESDFAGLGPHGTLAAGRFHVGAATTTAQRILYNPATGFLSFDQDGSGSTYAPIHFATLTTHPVIHNTDFIVEA